MIDTNENIVQ